MELIWLISGIVIGVTLAWFALKAKAGAVSDAQIAQHPIVAELRRNLSDVQNELRDVRKEKDSANTLLATSEANRKSLEVALAQQDDVLQKARSEFKTEFENLANRIFEEKTKNATAQNKEQLDLVLTPLSRKLKEFEEKVERVYQDENKERINLKKEIELLAGLNKQLSGDANNLAVALKGDNKSQGNWGEMILEKILERSGLVEGSEYKTQESAQNVDGTVIRPDVVVFLPEKKHLIIDSKVSLIAYNNMISASSDEERMRFLKQHSESIRKHIKDLGEKNYQTAKTLNSPDFVLLFMPIEAAFSAAMQYDQELYQFAWDRKIVLVSPTTLLASLRTVASIWMQERRVINAEAIAEEGGKLYDKFVAFTDDLLAIGSKIEASKKEYDEAMKKLSTGTGNLIRRAENMKKLGVKQQKQLNQTLLDKADEE
ncbi:MAG: DNA recombination protein RmuC [Flavobacteriales bacterium]|nr:DNA recombination protein RmuC [Flavobacteriales bacterium]